MSPGRNLLQHFLKLLSFLASSAARCTQSAVSHQHRDHIYAITTNYQRLDHRNSPSVPACPFTITRPQQGALEPNDSRGNRSSSIHTDPVGAKEHKPLVPVSQSSRALTTKLRRRPGLRRAGGGGGLGKMAPSPTKRKDRSDEKSKDRSKDKGATKESSEKDRGRDKTRKRRSASSGSSSTRSRSSSTSSSGSSTSTGSSSGSSSSSASSRSGSSSTSRSSSSSSSSGSPSPSRRRHDNRRRSRSKSKPPKRDEKERKRRSPSPKPTKVHIGRLTRNVTKDHIMEIFSTYGKIKMIDMPVERMHPHLSKGYAYVEFENPDEAEKALKHMDGGQIDGQEITATAVLAPWPRPPPRRFSPPRRMLPPPPMWRRSPPRMRRRSRSPRRRSPVRRRSRSPGRRRHRSRSSSNSSR